MASVDFFAINIGYDYNLKISGSGLGFFASGGWGRSVSVGEYQETTFVTDGNAAVHGAQINNVKYVHPSSGEVAGSTVLDLLNIPNYQATLNIRVTHSEAIQIQSPTLYIYDRVSTNNPASGVTCKVAEIIHLGEDQEVTGSGDTTWYTPTGSSVVVPLSPSPGISGLWAGDGTDSTHTDTRHDWFVSLSASPSTIGAKTQFGLSFSAEYL
jgi:hypothetical protein